VVYAVYAAIGVALLCALLGTILYVRRDRSRAVISTTEWVRLMRINDVQFNRATNAKARESRPKPPKIPPAGKRLA
jgi:uncharacterized membrane protein